MSRSIISMENVSYSYPLQKTQALDGISLTIAEGEFIAVMGENLCGKTTFCKLINGIIPHSTGGRLKGAVIVDGENTKKTTIANLACRAGMVFDDPDIQLFTSSVRHEAAFGPENLLLPVQEIEKRVEYWLKIAGLAGFEERPPPTLSGGEKQRLAIAAALAMEGKIIILDEPLARLDSSGASDFLSVIRNIREKRLLTVIMATHNSAAAAQFADRVCILKKGRLTACDTPQAVFADSRLLEENGIQPPAARSFDEADISGFFIEDNKRYNTAGRDFAPFVNKKLSCSEPKNEAITIKNFCYSYGPQNVSAANINLSIAHNDFAAIIGRNGCGKTTLLKSIAGLLRPSAGDVFVNGKNTRDLPVSVISREVGFVMQNPGNQLFTDTVYSEVSFALKKHGLEKTEIKKRTEAALYTMGLEDSGAFPHSLNRADRTRTVIACVLAMGCRIIILDEADVGQDYRDSCNIMKILKNLNAQGCTIVFVTHNMSLVCDYADRVIMMERNGIIMDRRRIPAA